MRLLYVTSHFPHGSSEPFLVPELEELSRLGHDVLVLPLRLKGPNKLNGAVQDRRVRLHTVPLWASRVVARAAAESLRLSPKVWVLLREIIRSGGPTTKLKNLAAIPKALYASWLARTWGADHIHAYWAATPATVAMVAAEITGLPWTFTGHRWEFTQRDLFAVKLQAAHGARLISASGQELLRTALVKEGMRPGAARTLAARAQVIHLGVDVPPRAATRPSTPTILCPAHLVPVKGHIFLLRAMEFFLRQQPQAKLLLAGDGPLKSRLEARARKLGIDRHVVFLGHVPRRDLLAMYERGEISCVVLASVVFGPGVHEGIPVSLMEAMSYGVPVIATATGGIPELLKEGAGILVPERDPESIAEAMLRLHTDPGFWEQQAIRSRGRVAARFSARGRCEELLAMMTGAQ